MQMYPKEKLGRVILAAMWDTGSTSTVCHSHYDNAMYISEKKSGINVPLQ